MNGLYLSLRIFQKCLAPCRTFHAPSSERLRLVNQRAAHFSLGGSFATPPYNKLLLLELQNDPDYPNVVSACRVGQVSIPAYSAAAMESHPTEFPDRN
jgi:hypothetical protein